MTIDQTNVVDFVALDTKTNEALLVITDHLEWTDDDKWSKEHMFLLQEKVNAYLGFIESGDIYQRCPEARGRAIVIRVVSKYPLSEEARRFCEKIRSFLADAGYRIEFEYRPLDTE